MIDYAINQIKNIDNGLKELLMFLDSADNNLDKRLHEKKDVKTKRNNRTS